MDTWFEVNATLNRVSVASCHMAISGDSNGELEKTLWETAKKLRGPVDPSEYKDFALGLLFLKSMSDSFEARRQELEEKTHDPDSRYYTEEDKERKYILTDKDEYKRENVFYLPEEARWQYFVDNATDPQIGKKIDDAMRAIEEENPRLKGILPKGYSRSSLASNGSDALEGLINLFADIDMEGENGDQDEDIFGRIYEYFIKQFAMEGGQKGGEFYTPKSVVELMVEILEPYEGRIFDPFSGSGGMFVQSQKFIENHGGDTDKISIYGQEIKENTLQISKMNLYLRGLDGNIKQGDSILNDQHKGLEADYILTNPPFNMSEWGKDQIADDDPRFKYGMPPSTNANYAFIQHMIHHLADTGMAATVMANGAMSAQSKQGKIRKSIIKDDLLDAVIALPGELFYTTSIPACIFVLSKGKTDDEYRDRSGETLFIDAREEYSEINSTLNKIPEDSIERIVDTIRAYRGEEGAENYEDITGFCSISKIDEIKEHNWVITPGRYVGIPETDDGDNEPFDVKMDRLNNKLSEQFDRGDALKNEIRENLKRVDYNAN
jgi:type I restriction enzyme M protein